MRRAWVGMAVLWAAACVGVPPAARPVEPVGTTATSAALPSETTPTQGAAHASAPTASAAASSSPHAPDDPTQCIDTPAEFLEWDTEVTKRFESALPDLSRCTRSLAHLGQVEIWASFKEDGRSSAVRITRSSVDDCEAVKCIERGLARLSAKPVPKGKLPIFTRTLTLAAGAAPHLGQAEWRDGVDRKLCLDVPNLAADAQRGRIPPEQIQAIIRAKYDAFRRCYEAGLARDRTLKGRVSVRFDIDTEGHVQTAHVVDNTIPDCQVTSCVRDGFEKLEFPKPDGGIVTVVYPIMLEPG